MQLTTRMAWFILTAVISVATALLAPGCGGHGSAGVPEETTVVTGGPFDIPAPATARGVGYVADGLTRAGTEHFPASEFIVRWISDSAGICTYLPDWAPGSVSRTKLSLAAYAFTLADFAEAHRITFELPQTGDPTDMWVGLANWEDNRWDWHQPVDGVINTSLADCIHPDDAELIIVVVFTGSDPWQIESITIGGDFQVDGYVYDEDGTTPLEGVTVGYLHTATEALLTDTTGADGYWSITNPPYGAFTATPELEGRTFSPACAEGEVDGLELRVDPFVAALRTVVTIDGLIYLDDGVTPVEGVTVVVESGSDWYSDKTDSDGYYRLTDIYGGELTVTPHNVTYEYTPAERVLDATEDRTLSPFLATPNDLYTVDGYILRDDGVTPAVGVDVHLYSYPGYFFGSTETDDNGYWAIEGVPAYTYTLFADKDHYTFDPTQQEVTVVDQDVTVDTIHGTWPDQYRLHGYIQDYDTSAGIAGVEVLVIDLVIQHTVYTDASGHWEVPEIFEGRYMIMPLLVPYRFIPSSPEIEVDRDYTMETIRGQRLDTVTIDGYIYEEGTTTPVPDVTVVFRQTPLEHEVVTDSTGHYSAELPDGTWWIDPSSTCWSFTPSYQEITVDGAPKTLEIFYVEPGSS